MSERVLHEINIAYRNSPIKIAYYSIAGELISISEGSEIDKQFKNQIENDLQADTKDSKIEYLRNWYAEEKLTQLLFKQNCIDIPGPKDNENTVEYISGRYYRKMTNGMLVSCYLNIKEIGSSYNALTDIAFEIVEELENNFRRDKDYLNTFDVLVTPSNTALLIAATVQAIIEKPVICVDRLGPIPMLQLQTQKLKTVLHGKKVIVIEEITATGNEIDRTIMFLNHLGASIVKIIVVYNLEVGIAMLAKPGEIISLCHPKKELAYVYRSK
jgi:orotate phosphoribosyltransferase